MLRALGWIVLGIIGLPVAWLGSAFIYETWHTYTYRYRLTIEVEADGKSHFGSGIIQSSLTRKATWIPQTGGTYSGIRGEAIVVDLGERGMLFALLRSATSSDYASRIVLDAFPAAPGIIRASSENMRRYSDGALTTELHHSQYPRFVRFRDIDDPMSVEAVDPRDLSKSFGPGVALKQIVLATTVEPISRGIDAKLTWLTALNGRYLSGKANSIGTPLGLRAADFQRR